MTVASRQSFNKALNELGELTGQSTLSNNVRLRAQKISLDTPFKAAEAASSALAAVSSVANQIAVLRGNRCGEVSVASRHAEASLLSFLYLRFQDEEHAPAMRLAPENRTAAAGFFCTEDDRWVYLHPGFPHNTEGLLKLLGTEDLRDAVTAEISHRTADELEDAIGQAGLCGAMVRSAREWDDSAPGRLLAQRPVVEIIRVGDSPPEPFPKDQARPLDGVKVLDLTRILAGPTCARTLAAHGANVLRVGAAHLPTIPLFAVDTGFGKRACNLDLRNSIDAVKLRRMVRKADIFSQGYRSGAMERLGFGLDQAIATRPGLVYVSINCYGHEGPWRTRPGWEQLAQTATGMADIQGQHLNEGQPALLPAAVNDYTTGYLAAFGALTALMRRAESCGSYSVRVTLARTAVWIRKQSLRRSVAASSVQREEIGALCATMDSAWGPIDYLRPAASLSNTDVGWHRPPSPLGTDSASF